MIVSYIFLFFCFLHYSKVPLGVRLARCENMGYGCMSYVLPRRSSRAGSRSHSRPGRWPSPGPSSSPGSGWTDGPRVAPGTSDGTRTRASPTETHRHTHFEFSLFKKGTVQINKTHDTWVKNARISQKAIFHL